MLCFLFNIIPIVRISWNMIEGYISREFWGPIYGQKQIDLQITSLSNIDLERLFGEI